jgi:starch synthase
MKRGLADVVGALPRALIVEGARLRTLVPGYPSVTEALSAAETVYDFAHLFGGRARLIAGRAGCRDLFVLDAPHLFARPGNPYASPNGQAWPDNAFRFAALARVGASLGSGLLINYTPAVIHAHDWQAGLTPAYLYYDGGPRPATVMTVHNLEFRPIFGRPAAALGPLSRSFSIDGVEYYGGIGFLKAGRHFADQITTAQPRGGDMYAGIGHGSDGLLRTRADVYAASTARRRSLNPATDSLIVAVSMRSVFSSAIGTRRNSSVARGSKPMPMSVVRSRTPDYARG